MDNPEYWVWGLGFGGYLNHCNTSFISVDCVFQFVTICRLSFPPQIHTNISDNELK